MDAKVSTKTKTKTFQNLNKNCPLDFRVVKSKNSMASFSVLSNLLGTVFVKILKRLSLSLSADLCIHSY